MVSPKMFNQFSNSAPSSPQYFKDALNYARQFESPNGTYTLNNLTNMFGFKMTPAMAENLDLNHNGQINPVEAALGVIYEDQMTKNPAGYVTSADAQTMGSFFQKGNPETGAGQRFESYNQSNLRSIFKNALDSSF